MENVKHKHHDMIVAWAANPSRVVEYYNYSQDKWKSFDSPSWDASLQYRFADEAPEREFPKTNLRGEYLAEIYENEYNNNYEDVLAVANAAIKQYILDTEEK